MFIHSNVELTLTVILWQILTDCSDRIERSQKEQLKLILETRNDWERKNPF